MLPLNLIRNKHALLTSNITPSDPRWHIHFIVDHPWQKQRGKQRTREVETCPPPPRHKDVCGKLRQIQILHWPGTYILLLMRNTSSFCQLHTVRVGIWGKAGGKKWQLSCTSWPVGSRDPNLRAEIYRRTGSLCGKDLTFQSSDSRDSDGSHLVFRNFTLTLLETSSLQGRSACRSHVFTHREWRKRLWENMTKGRYRLLVARRSHLYC